MEEQSVLWQKQYEAEERRIEEEYQRNLAEINKVFRKAAEEIALEFAAKRAEVKKQFSRKNLGESSASDSTQVTCPSKSLSGCTTSKTTTQLIAVNDCQSNPGFKTNISTGIRTDETAYVSHESGVSQNNSDKNSQCGTDQFIVSLCWPHAGCRSATNASTKLLWIR